MPIKRTVGLALFGASWLVWGCVFALPWLEATPSVKVAAGGGLWGLSYVFFGAGVALLGKEAWDRMKGTLRARLGWGSAPPGDGGGSGHPPGA